VIDVRRNDRTPSRDFIAYKFRGDLARDRRPQRISHVLPPEGIPRPLSAHLEEIVRSLEFHIFADRDEFHLGRDHARPRIRELRHDPPWPRPKNRPLRAVKKLNRISPTFSLRLSAMSLREITIVERLHDTSPRRLHIAAFLNPFLPQRGQAESGIAMKCRVSPRSRRVVHAYRFVGDFGPIGQASGRKRYLAHRHEHIGTRARHIDATRGRKKPVRRGEAWRDVFGSGEGSR
jgi:hypothetical protein